MWVSGQLHASPLYPWGRDSVPILQEAGWNPVPVWRRAENSPTQGFHPRTVQFVANRYTNCTISAHELTNKTKLKYLYEEEYEEKGKHEGKLRKSNGRRKINDIKGITK
jgi:hypothetical protein